MRSRKNLAFPGISIVLLAGCCLLMVSPVVLGNDHQSSLMTPGDIIKLIQAAPGFDKETVQARYLYEKQTWEIESKHRGVFHREFALEICSDSAKHEHGDVRLNLCVDHQVVELLCAETILPDGTVLPIMDGADNELTLPELAHVGTMFGDHRVRVISFSGVEAGAIIHCAYRYIEDHEKTGDFICAPLLFQSTLPIITKEVVIKHPDSLNVKFSFHNDCPEVSDTLIDGEKVYTWTIQNLDPMEEEYGMPGWVGMYPFATVTTLDNWDEFARWFSLGFRVEDPAFEWDSFLKKVGITPGQKLTFNQKTNRCYRFVADSIQSLSVPFKSRGYRPSSLSEILDRGYGDELDKCYLLYAMFKHLNIPAEIALFPGTRTDIQGDIISPALLNRIAVVVKTPRGEQRWLDPVENYYPTEWFWEGSGKRGRVFSIDNGISREEQIPAPGPAESINHQMVEVEIHGDGSATGTMTCEATGIYEIILRRYFQERSDHEVDLLWERFFDRGAFPMAIIDLSCSSWREHSGKIEFTVDFSADWAGTITGDMMVFPLPDIPVPGKRQIYAIDLSRQYPVLLDYAPSLETLDVTVKIPEGYALEYCPGDQYWSNGGYSMLQNYEAGLDTVMLRRQIQWKTEEVSPEQYNKIHQIHSRHLGDGENLIMLRQTSGSD